MHCPSEKIVPIATASFRSGTIVDIDGRKHTLLRKIDSKTWQLEDTLSGHISMQTVRELEELYDERKLHFCQKTSSGIERLQFERPLAAIPESLLEAAKIRMHYVKAILSLPTSENMYIAAIQSAWEQIQEPKQPPHWATVARWKKRYVDSGNSLTALVELRHRKGNRTHRYPEEVMDAINVAIEDVYLRRERASIQDVVDHASGLLLRENQLRPAQMALPRPTRRAIKRAIQTIPAFDRCVARYGREVANKRFRTVLGHRITKSPLERVEVDHTPLDFIVVCDKSSLPLGRPYLTVMIDDYSRCVLGFYISFEPPSYFTVARCLEMALMPKSKLLAAYPEIVSEWNAHGVMQTLVVDNGAEFHSKSLENACFALGIELSYAPRKTPWFKGKVERFFRTINDGVVHKLPGTTFSNILDRGDYDSSKMTVVSLAELRSILYRWVVDIYHQKIHRTLAAPPAVVWERSISSEDIRVPTNPDELAMVTGKSESRVLGEHGIELYGLRYNSPEMSQLRRKFSERMHVEVRVNPADLGSIYVIAPSGAAWYTVPCLNTEYANGLSHWQHNVCKRYAAKNLEGYGPEVWLEAKLQIQEWIAQRLGRKGRKTRAKEARFENFDAAASNKKAQKCDEQPPPTLPEPAAEIPQLAQTNPITEDDLQLSPSAAPLQSAPRKSFKPVFRDRSQQSILDEQLESEGERHE